MTLLQLPLGFSLVQVAQLAGLSTVSVAVFFLTQRIFFHRLSRFPGPWLNAISEIPAALAIVRGRQFAYNKSLHEKYGPVVRVAPNELIFCGGTAWEDIYGNKVGKDNMEKSPLQMGGLPPGLTAYAITQAPKDNHTRQRRALASAFSTAALLQQEPLIHSYVDKLIGQLHKLVDEGKLANMTAWLTYLSFDIIGDLTFAEPFGCLENGAETDWSRSLIHMLRAGAYEHAIRRVAGMNTWAQRTMVKYLVPGFYRQWRIRHFVSSKQRALQRLGDSERDHKDFIYYILKNNESKQLLSEMEIVMNSALFLGAGSDTTAIMLAAWVNLMLRNRKEYEQLVQEVRSNFKAESEISWSAVKDLPYLGAVINETLRMSPPVPSNLCRVVPAAGGVVDGSWVPGGTVVSVSPWAATHLPVNFKEPLSFRPERWLDADAGRFKDDNQQASQPFSYGPRGCLGRNLAYIEQRLTICRLLWNFDLESPGESEAGVENWRWDSHGDMKHVKAFIVWDKPDLWVRLRKVVR